VLLAIARFELAKRRRMLSTYVYALALFAFGFLTMIAAGGAFSSVSVSSGPDKVLANAPHLIQGLVGLLTLLGLMLVASVFGQAVHQDFESRMDALFFTAPVGRVAYLGGRFLGAFAFALALFCAIGLGMWIGTHMWFCDAARFGANRLSYYAWPYLTTVIPNLWFAGALFFALATLSRRITPVYVGSVVLVIGYLVTGNLLHKLENRPLAALLDPFGMRAATLLTEYWTIHEQNTLPVPLRGLLLANRLAWSAVGAALLLVTVRGFRREQETVAARRDDGAPAPRLPAAGAADPRPDGAAAALAWRLPALLARATWLAFRGTVQSVYFGVIVLAGVLFMVTTTWSGLGALYGTSTYPVTYAVLDLTAGSFSIITLIIITLYAGDLVFRSRDARMDQILDALPTPTWLPHAAALLSLVLVQVVLLGVVLATGVAIQTAKGYFHYELALYLKELFGLRLIGYALLCVLALTVQTLVDHKHLGHFVMVLYYAFTLFMGNLGLEHRLYKFADAPPTTYSDMNRYGHFLRGVFWFDAYWAAFAVGCALLIHLFWVRGVDRALAVRAAVARQRLTRGPRVAGAFALAAFAALGGYIFYNTNVVNRYRTEHARERDQADYEKQYRRLRGAPQPRITDVRVAFDIFPERPAIVARGQYRLRNKTAAPISSVYVAVDDEAEVRGLTLGGAAASAVDRRMCVYTFSQALAPGAESTLAFDLEFGQRGFPNGAPSTAAVENGTFFSSSRLPSIGYQRHAELTADSARKKYGLAPKERAADVDDLEARKTNDLTADADWVTFEAEVSTAPDQIAVAPGTLEREWTDGGRRYFRYKMDAPILHFFSVLSARYQVRRDRWNDVALEIYYHPGHEFDLEQMLRGMKGALAYATAHFGPYQHRQVRILEFPRYESFAQSFPNTIPYSEAIGFIAHVQEGDDEDIDYPFYVTAHEVAHQWWGHQVVGGDVQGAAMLSETLAQYTALMVMKHAFGADKMRRFLKYELDGYLSGRTVERKKEQPLARCEDQPYIHYQKGSLAMYALQDFVGEERVDQALAAYLAKVKLQEPPYTNTTELLAELRKVTPPDLAYLIGDLFERITLYDNRVRSADARRLADGHYQITLALVAKKLQADALGEEKEVPMDDLLVVGGLDERGVPVYLEKRRVRAGESQLTFTVPSLPAKAGIDPLAELIDRKPDDNLARVTLR
jgi:hypothetical protein